VVELASPQIVDEEHLDTDHDTDVPLQFRRMDNFLGLAPVHGWHTEYWHKNFMR
jgi:hypothetical protein